MIYEINLEKFFDEKLQKQFEEKSAKILTIENSPIIDIVGIGLNTGDILIINLKQDKLGKIVLIGSVLFVLIFLIMLISRWVSNPEMFPPIFS